MKNLNPPSAYPHRLGAMGAAAGSQRNLTQALRARLRRGRNFGLELFQPRLQVVERQYYGKINHHGHNQKRNSGIEEVADLDVSTADVHYYAAEVRFAHCGRNQRVQYVAHQRRDDGVEGRAENDGNGQVYDVSTQNEIAKSPEHISLLSLACASPCHKPHPRQQRVLEHPTRPPRPHLRLLSEKL